MVAPLLMIVLFGTLEVGRFIISREMLAYAVIVGARQAAVMGTADAATVQTTVVQTAPLLSLSTSAVNVTDQSGAAFAARAVGDVMQVQVTYQFQPAIPIPGWSGASWTETQTAVCQ